MQHPDLAKQLETCLRDRSKKRDTRCTAIDIAHDCKIESLGSVIADIALDGSDEYRVRHHAGYSLDLLTDGPTRARLHPLLHQTEKHDPWDCMKGNAMRAMWPDHISTGALFARITPPRRQNYGGSYSNFVGHELPEKLRSEDLLAALKWLSSDAEKLNGWYASRRLVAAILKLAWEHLDLPDILDCFAEVALKRLGKHKELILGDDGHNANTPVISDNKRRQLIAAIVRYSNSQDLPKYWYWSGHLQLVSPEDLEWLIMMLRNSKSDLEKRVWAELVFRAYDWSRHGHLDQILESIDSESVVAREFGDDFRSVELNSARAVEMRKSHEQYLEIAKRAITESRGWLAAE